MKYLKMIFNITLVFVFFAKAIYAKESTIDLLKKNAILDLQDITKKESNKKEEKLEKPIFQEKTKENLEKTGSNKDKTIQDITKKESNSSEEISGGTIIENVGVDNQSYPIRRTINSSSSDNSAESYKERIKSDARQFISFKTKNGQVFYLIIDHDKSNNNVKLLTEVSENDLQDITKKESNKKEEKLEKPIFQEKTKENLEKTGSNKDKTIQDITKKESNSSEEIKKSENKNTYIFFVFILIGGIGLGYYFKIVKPKQEEDFDYGEDESDDEFFDESKEEFGEI